MRARASYAWNRRTVAAAGVQAASVLAAAAAGAQSRHPVSDRVIDVLPWQHILVFRR